MFNAIKRSFSILKVVNADTHLWCVSVLAGAILLCVSFFVEPSQRQFASSNDENESVSIQTVIEYSSVLGSLSSIENLEESDVDRIAEVIPAEFDEYYDGGVDEVSDVSADVSSLDALLNDTKEASVPLPVTPQVDIKALTATPVPSVDLTVFYSPETIDVLERLVQCEAGTEDMDGRLLVANVVLNRVDTGIWGNDILSVCMAEGQFDPIRNGAYKSAEVDSVTKKAVINALLGEDISQGAIYFQKSNAKIWGNKKFLFRHGNHSFYK